MQLSFGSGAVWGERTDVVGSGIGPRQFGVLQDIQIDFDWSEKELYGQLQFPVAIARGQGKITGKAKFAQILGLLYSDIFFGVTPATGQFAVSQLEAGIVPATTPYTVIAANAANYNDDLGVSYAGSGKRFNRVTTPSAAGQYSVNFATGLYTFSSADASAAVLISYTYNIATSGNKLTLSNQPMGVTPTFKATFYSAYNGSGTALRLNACTANKLSLPTKLDNWTINELDFTAFADASGTIGYLSTVE
ncbi:MAG: hypothetical protein JO095_20325 [Alphaproteobacteria bacterium]|nr:hypothetical protein [Alphaproteobacteria bacterium]